MKGRKRTPTRLVMLKGGSAYTHRPVNDKEPTPPPKLPPCPKQLDKVARKEWRRVGKVLMAVRLLTDLDRAVMAAYCQGWSEWLAALEQVQKRGTILAKPGLRAGEPQIPYLNPWLRVAREACERWMKAGAVLGLSPAGRAMLRVENPKPAGKFAGLIEAADGR